MKGQNERKVNYNKELCKINAIGHLVKTNPIKPNLPVFGRKSETERTRGGYLKKQSQFAGGGNGHKFSNNR